MTYWKLTLSYNGQRFHGWQIQPGQATIQGLLAEALVRVSGERVLPQGAGRTDAGVHALGQVCSFALRSRIPARNLVRALNRMLPSEIRVLEADIVPGHFHARHSARGKRYEYRIFERRVSPGKSHEYGERICSPFLAPFVWDCRWPLALELLQTASSLIVGTHDFSAMAASSGPVGSDPFPDEIRSQAEVGLRPTSRPNPVKTIYSAEWSRRDELLIFSIHGSGFLHHMVRNIVGTMVDVGRGSLPLTSIPSILASRDRSAAGPTAPASGLYLMEVFYPKVEAEEQTQGLEPILEIVQ